MDYNEMADKIIKDEMKSTLEILILAKEKGLTIDDVIQAYQKELI
jgi:hypothetical protein